MLNILLINVHSSYNAGDAALTQSAIDQLQDQFPGSKISLVMNDPQSLHGDHMTYKSFLTWVNETQKQQALRFFWLVFASIFSMLIFRLSGKHILLPVSAGLRTTISAFLSADMVVSTPGGYLYSYGKGRALVVILYTMLLPIIAGKPLYLLPQSIGPFQSKAEIRFARFVLSRACAIMTREQVSFDYLDQIGIMGDHCHLIPDMAFTFKGSEPEQAEIWFTEHNINLEKVPTMGLTVIDWGAQFHNFGKQESYESAITSAIRHFVATRNGQVILFPQCWGPTAVEDDRIPSRRIAENLKDINDSILVVQSPLAPGLLKALYGQMDLFIGTRMHSNIFAISQNVPVIAIGYLHKTLGIANMAGIEDWVLDIQEIDRDSLLGLLDNLWREKDRVRQQLSEHIPSVIDQAHRAGKIIAEHYINHF